MVSWKIKLLLLNTLLNVYTPEHSLIARDELFQSKKCKNYMYQISLTLAQLQDSGKLNNTRPGEQVLTSISLVHTVFILVEYLRLLNISIFTMRFTNLVS